MATKGLWNIGGINLPDFGISEALGLGQKNAAIVTPNYQSLNYSNNSVGPQPKGGTAYLGPAVMPKGTTGATKISSIPGASIVNPTPTSGDGGNGGGATGGSPAPKPISYLNNDPRYGQNEYNPWASLETAAQMGDQAAITQLENMYAQRDAELQNQLNYAGEQKTNTLSELDRQLQNYFTGVDKQKVQTNEDVSRSINDASSTAQNVQRQNRNVLRGLGILNSSYAGDQLAQPMNQFDTQRAQLQQWGLSQISNLDEQKRQKQGEADSQKNQIISQFNDLIGKIQTDMRFNEREKNGAYMAAKAVLQQRMAEIQTQRVNYEQQIANTRNTLLSDLVKLQMTQSPKADISSIMAKSLAAIQAMNTPQPTQGINIFGATDSTKRKLLSGSN